MKINCNENIKKKYENIFIIENMSQWLKLESMYRYTCDLVLTYDFKLTKHIKSLNGDVFYIDYLIDNKTIKKDTSLAFDFFNNWHLNSNNKDIFVYKKVNFGFSFRLDFWNDYLSYIRIYLSLNVLKTIEYKSIYLSSKSNKIANVLNDLKINYKKIDYVKTQEIGYYFPIEEWLDEKIRPSGLRNILVKLRAFVSKSYGLIMPFFDELLNNKKKYSVLIQNYHPTKDIIKYLRKDNKTLVLLENFTRYTKISDNLKERLFPIIGSLNKYEQITNLLISSFKKNKYHKLILSNGDDISKEIYSIIENRINSSIAKKLRIIDSSLLYIDKYGLDMEILIANIGETITVFDCVCKSRDIPSYLIVNGLMISDYFDDGKYATVINSYSNSIKHNYFKGMNNIVILGDPRMDQYILDFKSPNINREIPTITIGAASFGNTSLYSYVAIEFEFLYDILSAFSILKEKRVKFNINIKIRANGYFNQYVDFVSSYFSGLNINIEDTISMKDILSKTDLYISIHSQTIFEASCMGIPVIYYKIVKEIFHPPFDNNSELVTVTNKKDLIQAFYDFQNKHKRYDSFLNREIMEKYIGPLDGKNLQRNIDIIYELLEKGHDK